jgi:predicted ATPase with chaperone activity
MVNLQEIEAKAAAAIHDIIGEAVANEPQIEAAARDALLAAGAPGVIASGIETLLGALLSHFTTEQAVKAAAEQPVQEQPEG